MKKKAHDKDVLLDRGAWVPKVVSILPLIEREKRKDRLRERRLWREGQE